METNEKYVVVVKNEEDIPKMKDFILEETERKINTDEYFEFRVANDYDRGGVLPKITYKKFVYCGSFITALLETLTYKRA